MCGYTEIEINSISIRISELLWVLSILLYLKKMQLIGLFCPKCFILLLFSFEHILSKPKYHDTVDGCYVKTKKKSTSRFTKESKILQSKHLTEL